jgi:tRNA uridine 5-carbamoylmethylation protein Kti12
MEFIIIQGIPGSGKSALAKRVLKQYGSKNAVIINRDSIRNMLGEYWIPDREPLVTLIENHMMTTALASGYTVINDGTNLNPKTLKNLIDIVKKFNKTNQGDKVEILYMPIKISINRAYLQMLWEVIKGGKYIKYDVIKSFYTRYKHIIGVK